MLHRLAARFLMVIAGTAAVQAGELPERRLGDLDVAQREYIDQSPVFSPRAREAGHALLADLRARAASMNDGQFVFALAQIAALADNGHDTIHVADGGWWPSLRLPVRMIWFDDALVIARASPEASELLGASVLRLESTTPAQLMERLRLLQGGIDGLRRWQLTWVFQNPESLHAIGVTRQPDRVELLLKLTDGRTVTRTLAARPAAEVPPGQSPARYWIPGPWKGEQEKGWRAAADATRAPLYLQAPDEWFRMVDITELDALYVQFRSNFDEGEAKIAPFVAEVSSRLKSSPPKNLILDMRFDTGGDNTQNRDLMHEIAQRVPGRIYVLIGNYTFSAGIASVAALKHDGGDKVKIVGAPSGDRTHWWSEHGEPVCLPASKVCFSVNTGYWNLIDGCRDDPRCYGDQFDLNVASLEPALPAPLTSQDWLANRDPGMAAIEADLKTP